MPYYNDKREYFNGGLILYQRDLEVSNPIAKTHNKPKWYMRVQIKGMKGRALVRSTKLTVFEDAYEYAKEEYLRLHSAIRLGHTIDEYTFEQHWNEWFERKIKEGVWTESRQRWQYNYFKRYFSEYFTRNNKSLLLNEINGSVANGYWQWRINYWDSEKGKALIKYNPKRRNLKTTSTSNTSKVPANKTLKMEQSALNQIFYDAFENGRIQQVFKLKAPSVGNKDSQRASFTEEEYAVLTRYLRSYRDNVGIFKGTNVHKMHMLQRQQMYYLILFIANSGLRVGEVREVTWQDIKFDIDNGNEELIAEIRVSQHTKTKKVRNVQTQPNANDSLKKWKEITPFKKQNQYVFFAGSTEEQKQFTDLNKTFKTILMKIPYNDRKDGMLNDADGKRRSLYSLRHVYASMRLNRGVSIYDLSLNMGTRVLQIEKHYSHLLSSQRKSQITQMPKRVNKVDVVNDKDKSTNSLLDVAFSAFKDGKLSESAFNEIVSLHTKDG